jgi:hypothetical protein
MSFLKQQIKKNKKKKKKKKVQIDVDDFLSPTLKTREEGQPSITNHLYNTL